MFLICGNKWNKFEDRGEVYEWRSLEGKSVETHISGGWSVQV